MAYIDKIDLSIPEGRIIIRDGDIILKDEAATPSSIPLSQKWEDLIQYISKKGYSNIAICQMKRAISILADYNGYRKVEVHNVLRKKYSVLRVSFMWWLLYDFYDILPCNRKVSPSDYDYLTLHYRDLLDDCMRVAKKKDLRESTISVEASMTATFFRYLQEEGLQSIYQVKEDTLRKYSRVKRSEPALLYRIGLLVGRYAKDKGDVPLQRICALFPSQKQIRKVYEAMTQKEREVLETYLQDPSNTISKRDRAIVTLLLYTGIRQEDARDLQVSNIDWKNDLIVFHMQKNDRNHTLPLRPIVGNAIYDYIKNERPKDAGQRLFVSETKRRGEYSKVSIAFIVNRVYELCGIRRGGVRRGTHILRHNLADEMVNNGNDLSAVSKILGHEDPNITLGYLSANIEQLRRCALDLSDFPITHKLYTYGTESH